MKNGPHLRLAVDELAECERAIVPRTYAARLTQAEIGKRLGLSRSPRLEAARPRDAQPASRGMTDEETGERHAWRNRRTCMWNGS
jgi:hypothetical protein